MDGNINVDTAVKAFQAGGQRSLWQALPASSRAGGVRPGKIYGPFGGKFWPKSEKAVGGEVNKDPFLRDMCGQAEALADVYAKYRSGEGRALLAEAAEIINKSPNLLVTGMGASFFCGPCRAGGCLSRIRVCRCGRRYLITSG